MLSGTSSTFLTQQSGSCNCSGYIHLTCTLAGAAAAALAARVPATVQAGLSSGSARYTSEPLTGNFTLAEAAASQGFFGSSDSSYCWNIRKPISLSHLSLFVLDLQPAMYKA